MSEKPTAEYVRECLDYDPSTGIFLWKYRKDSPQFINSRVCGKKAGCKNSSGYWIIGLNGIHYYAHHLAFLIMYGHWPTQEIDHQDTDPSNNKWANLRYATSSQNKCNIGLRKDNTSGFKGVCFDRNRGKWIARIYANNRLYWLGRFDSFEKANLVYTEKAKILHADFRRSA